jgi:hypothetical protein
VSDAARSLCLKAICIRNLIVICALKEAPRLGWGGDDNGKSRTSNEAEPGKSKGRDL